MNIVNRIDQYNINNVFFCEAIKNNIMNDGKFVRIIYSTNSVTINGVYLLITLNDITCEKYYTKYKCIFNPAKHTELINIIKEIESELLKKYEIYNKIPQYKIYEQMQNGNLKIFKDTGNNSYSSFILKISGIWETTTDYGLTYKFMTISNN